MLLLFAKSLKDVSGANLHDGDLLLNALLELLANSGGALLVLSDFTVATSWHEVGNESHVFRVLHIRLVHTTLLRSKSFVLSVGHPVIVRLVVLMVLVERVVQVSVKPPELRDNTKVEWHLSVIISLVVVSGSDWVDLLIEFRMYDRISPVVVRLLPVVLWGVGRVEIVNRHINYYINKLHKKTISLMYMNHTESLNLKKLVRDSECEDNTGLIRKLKHSEMIKTDLEQMQKLKVINSKMRNTEPDKFSNLCQSKCNFLYTNYTDIYHKNFKDELNLQLMLQICILNMIEIVPIFTVLTSQI